MSDSPYYDDLETRDPDAREAALFASLPGQIAHAKAKAPYFAEIFADVDPDSVTGREALAALPVTRKSALIERQKSDPPFGGLAAVRGARVDALVWGRRGTAGRSPRRLQTMLAVTQGALALVLVVGAMLTVRSFQRLQGHGLGFDPDHTLVMRMRIPHTEDTFRDDVTEYSRAVRA